MFLHGVINFASNFVDYYYELFPEGYEVPVLIFNIVITLILMIVCFKVLGKRKSSQTVFSGVNPYE